MSDWTVLQLVEDFKAGRVTRRRFVGTLLGAGIGAPLISAILASCGSKKSPSSSSSGPTDSAAQAGQGKQQQEAFQPTKRGGGGTLRVLWWQAPVHANRHISTGTKENDASRIFTEPLAAWDPDTELFPVLAAEVPSLDNGQVARDGLSVVWKLKQGVTFHDGQPMTAEDVRFTYDYAIDPATAATTRGDFINIDRVEVVDASTVKLVFKEPTPLWNQAFVSGGHIFPKHLIDKYKGAESRNSPYNLKPVGTGPYKVVDFRPGDVITAEINPNYHVPNRPFFDRLEMKGGGDAPSAARAVLQTGEADYAWNMQVEPDILAGLEKNGIGRVVLNRPGAGMEHIQINFTDPHVEVDGENSSLKTKHPFFSDIKVRQAVALAVNRQLIVDQLYGSGGDPAVYMVYNPKKFMPESGKFEFNLQRAAQLLDEAGWRRSGSDVRTKDGKRLKVVFQTSVSSVRQSTQAIIKKDMESIGFEVELKAVDQTVFFSSDGGNPDIYARFSADMQMYNTSPSADPQTWWQIGLSTDAAQKANKWAGRNIPRYQNPEFDRVWNQARFELDPVKRADLLKKLNQIVIDDVVFVPIVQVNGRGAAKNNLKGVRLSTFDSTLWNLPFWYRE